MSPTAVVPRLNSGCYRFLDCSAGGKTPGRSLLDVGVQQALQDAGFDDKVCCFRLVRRA